METLPSLRCVEKAAKHSKRFPDLTLTSIYIGKKKVLRISGCAKPNDFLLLVGEPVMDYFTLYHHTGRLLVS